MSLGPFPCDWEARPLGRAEELLELQAATVGPPPPSPPPPAPFTACRAQPPVLLSTGLAMCAGLVTARWGMFQPCCSSPSRARGCVLKALHRLCWGSKVNPAS